MIEEKHTTAELIASFKDLPAGFYYGVGVPPRAEVIAAALHFERLLRHAAPGITTSACPGEMGDIQITADSSSGLSIEVSISHARWNEPSS